MNTSELRKVLGYLNIGLAIAHNRGVSIGHFGNGDFIELAETVNSLVLHAITPEAASVAGTLSLGVAGAGVTAPPVEIGGPVAVAAAAAGQAQA